MSSRRLTATVPQPPTALVGRRQDVADAIALLHDDETRLLTLLGPGGVGKTRLALELAHAVSTSDFPDGVVFVDLAAVADPALVPAEIAKRLGLPLDGSQPAEEVVRDAVGDQRLLLILDNFEHVLEAAAFVADLVALDRYGPVVLATSRERLNLRVERVYEVAPLALPSAQAAFDEIAASEGAVALFTQRARAVRPDFRLTEANAAAVTEICRRLDALPLAIELAAARIAHFSPEAMLTRMDPLLPFLAGGPRDAPARLRTMRNAVAWSYDFLTPAEQTLFRRLSVFMGGFSIEAAAAIGATEIMNDFRPSGSKGRFDLASGHIVNSDIVEAVSVLVDRSLLRLLPGPEDSSRFTMLETVRAYASELLDESDEGDEVHQAHLDWMSSFIARAFVELRGSDPGSSIQRIEAEYENLRSAVTWSLSRGLWTSALEIASNSWLFCKQRGYLSEVTGWLRQGVEIADIDSIDVANAYLLLGHGEPDHKTGQGYYEMSLRLYKVLGHKLNTAGALSSLGMLAEQQGDFVRAKSLHRESLEIFEKLGTPLDVAQAHYQLGCAASRSGDFSEATMHLDLARNLQEQEADTTGVAYTLMETGRMLRMRQRFREAHDVLSWSLRRFREVGFRDGIAEAQVQLGFLAVREGDIPAAAYQFRSALEASPDVGRQGVFRIDAIEGMAHVAATQRQFDLAVRLWSATAAWRRRTLMQRSQTDRDQLQRQLRIAEKELGDARFHAEWFSGESLLTLESAAKEAVSLEIATTDKSATRPQQVANELLSRLTQREQQVLCCIAKGLRDQQIADLLLIAPRTATTHVSRILAKLEVESRTAAAAQAVASGLCG